jgi:hypothetical protein
VFFKDILRKNNREGEGTCDKEEEILSNNIETGG